jgi:hypothetical protein
MNTPEGNFIQKNWSMISAAFVLTFAIGGLYTKDQIQDQKLTEMKSLYEQHLKDAAEQHELIQKKQEAKWGDIPEIEQRVDDLEELHSYDLGYKEGIKEHKK